MKNGKEVLSEVLETLGINAPTLAKQIGVKYQRLLDIQSKKVKKISFEVAHLINRVYPQFSLEYLSGDDRGYLNNSCNTIGENSCSAIGNGARASVNGSDASKLLSLLEKKDQQIDRLLAIIEELQKEIIKLKNE